MMLDNPCVAHRGFSGIAPENTLAAIRLAMKIPEVQGIEIDVQLSRDGVPVVIHDFTLGRTTNGSGTVREHTLSELKRLDAGRWKARAFTGERIPTLDEVLEEVRGRLRVNIELKTNKQTYAGLASAAVEAVRRCEMEEQVYFTSFEPGALIEARQNAPHIPRGLIVDTRSADLDRRLDEYGCTLLSIKHGRVDPVFVRSTLESGIKMMVWTVDRIRRMRELASMHPELMLCTNRPDRWLLARRLPLLNRPNTRRRWLGL